MLVRDEADIVRYTVNHLLRQVDHVIVMDNLSTDGTSDILVGYGRDVTVLQDEEIGYYQSRKTTRMALMALEMGHQWVVPCDADELWYANGLTVKDLLLSKGPDVQMVKAELYNHIPTSLDDDSEESPFRRIGWRKRQPGDLGKVACRLHPSLVIHAGNHNATYAGAALAATGLIIRHFSWRSPEQYLRKIRNGERAYAATNLPDSLGVHWRMFANATDEAVLDHYHQWFVSQSPRRDESLIFDPAPASPVR
jgi:glycosyltransferase involved in cell wall biosynthesis